MLNIGKTVYITKDDSHLRCDDNTLTVDLPDGLTQSLPYNVISEIIIFGHISLTFYLVNKCSEHGIIINVISPYGKYLGKFIGASTGNVLLRKKQFDMIGSDKSVDYVRTLVSCKIFNQMSYLKYINYRRDNSKISDIIDYLKQQKDNLKSINDIDLIRNVEALTSHSYFSAFDYILITDDTDMHFQHRSKKPPLNRVNALLSLFYTLTTSLCTSALFVRGLDSECGYLHVLRSGRNSLACDLVEEFRTCIVDRFVINLVNRAEIKSDDFEIDAEGIRLKSDSMRKLMLKWDAYLDDTYVIHKLYNKKLTLRLVVYEQAMLLAQYIRGDIHKYPPFLMFY